MALSTTANKVIHAGNASARVFPFTFPIPSASYLSVIYTDALGVETTLSPSLYSVSGIGTLTGGSVTYPLSGSVIALGTLLTIVRTVPYTQPTVLSNQGGYYPEVVEAALDRITMEMQQLAEIVSRFTVSSISNPATEQTNYTLIQALQQMDLLTVRGDLLTRAASSYARLARGTAGQFLGVSGSDLTWQTPATYGYGGVRQTVQHGPVTSAGLPSFLPSTNAALSITTQNVAAGYPLVASAANGSSTVGPVDAIGVSIANLTWSGLTASRAAATPNYLYGVIIGGAITPASTIVAPVYQWGGVPGVTSGLITFNIGEMRAYVGNGATASQTNLVLFGEAATDGSGVISTVAYAYNGRYESAFTATLPLAGVSVSCDHNIGVKPLKADFIIECTTIDNGYAVGEQVINPGGDNAAYVYPNPVRTTAKTVARTSASGNSGTSVTVVSTGAALPAVAASWKYKFSIARGW